MIFACFAYNSSNRWKRVSYLQLYDMAAPDAEGLDEAIRRKFTSNCHRSDITMNEHLIKQLDDGLTTSLGDLHKDTGEPLDRHLDRKHIICLWRRRYFAKWHKEDQTDKFLARKSTILGPVSEESSYKSK